MEFQVERTTKNGLESVILRSASGEFSAEVLLFGATVVSFTVGGSERLFVSDDAIWNGIKAIRGGIPICFPQFGQPLKEMSQHGFARNSHWTLARTETKDQEATVLLTLQDTEETRVLWPHAFMLRYRVTLSYRSLTTELTAYNPGDTDYKCQMLLHTYHRVQVSDMSVDSFEGCLCYDQLTKGDAEPETQRMGHIDREVDKIYLEKPGAKPIPSPLHISAQEGPMRVYKTASKGKMDMEYKTEVPVDVVFWNPWIDKAKSLADLPDLAYKNFVCVEPGIVQGWITLCPGESLTLSQILEARDKE